MRHDPTGDPVVGLINGAFGFVAKIILICVAIALVVGAAIGGLIAVFAS